MTTLLTIPISPEALTAPWLTEALRASGTITTAAVKTWEAERLGEGEGVMSQVVRVHLRYDPEEPALPHSLIAKFPTEAIDRFFVARLLRFYEREIGFYSDLQEHVPLRTPRCYYQARDPDTDAFVLLLEDLESADTGDQVAGSSLAKVERAIEQVAAMHADMWEHPLLDTLAWMPAWDDASLVPFYTETYRRAWQRFRQSPPGYFPEQIQSLGDRLDKAIKPLLQQLSQPPRTLLHGDYRLDNLFFGDPEKGEGLVVADWQLCVRGRGVFDVAYLLSQSVSPAVRQAEEMRLLGRYHHLLATGGVRSYSLEDCVLDYRRAVLLGMTFPIIAAQSMGRIEVRGQALAAAMVERSMAAVLDLKAAELLP